MKQITDAYDLVGVTIQDVASFLDDMYFRGVDAAGVPVFWGIEGGSDNEVDLVDEISQTLGYWSTHDKVFVWLGIYTREEIATFRVAEDARKTESIRQAELAKLAELQAKYGTEAKND